MIIIQRVVLEQLLAKWPAVEVAVCTNLSDGYGLGYQQIPAKVLDASWHDRQTHRERGWFKLFVRTDLIRGELDMARVPMRHHPRSPEKIAKSPRSDPRSRTGSA